MEDTEIMEAFFSNADHGRKVLSTFSDLKWQFILEDTF